MKYDLIITKRRKEKDIISFEDYFIYPRKDIFIDIILKMQFIPKIMMTLTMSMFNIKALCFTKWYYTALL